MNSLLQPVKHRTLCPYQKNYWIKIYFNRNTKIIQKKTSFPVAYNAKTHAYSFKYPTRRRFSNFQNTPLILSILTIQDSHNIQSSAPYLQQLQSNSSTYHKQAFQATTVESEVQEYNDSLEPPPLTSPNDPSDTDENRSDNPNKIALTLPSDKPSTDSSENISSESTSSESQNNGSTFTSPNDPSDTDTNRADPLGWASKVQEDKSLEEPKISWKEKIKQSNESSESDTHHPNHPNNANKSKPKDLQEMTVEEHAENIQKGLAIIINGISNDTMYSANKSKDKSTRQTDHQICTLAAISFNMISDDEQGVNAINRMMFFSYKNIAKELNPTLIINFLYSNTVINIHKKLVVEIIVPYILTNESLANTNYQKDFLRIIQYLVTNGDLLIFATIFESLNSESILIIWRTINNPQEFNPQFKSQVLHILIKVSIKYNKSDPVNNFINALKHIDGSIIDMLDQLKNQIITSTEDDSDEQEYLDPIEDFIFILSLLTGQEIFAYLNAIESGKECDKLNPLVDKILKSKHGEQFVALLLYHVAQNKELKSEYNKLLNKLDSKILKLFEQIRHSILAKLRAQEGRNRNQDKKKRRGEIDKGELNDGVKKYANAETMIREFNSALNSGDISTINDFLKQYTNKCDLQILENALGEDRFADILKASAACSNTVSMMTNDNAAVLQQQRIPKELQQDLKDVLSALNANKSDIHQSLSNPENVNARSNETTANNTAQENRAPKTSDIDRSDPQNSTFNPPPTNTPTPDSTPQDKSPTPQDQNPTPQDHNPDKSNATTQKNTSVISALKDLISPTTTTDNITRKIDTMAHQRLVDAHQQTERQRG